MKNNPFSIFDKEEEQIRVEALGGAEITIKTTLTIGEQLRHDELMYKNMGTSKEGIPFWNPSDRAKAQVYTVSAILLKPKMTIIELNKLNGAAEAIDEIYSSFLNLKNQRKTLIEGN